MVASLIDLDILTCDVKGSYLTAECCKISYTISGAKFGIEEGVIMIVNMDLYGLISSAAAFRANLARVLHELNYQHTNSYPDGWL